jgi:hypothetical protein
LIPDNAVLVDAYRNALALAEINRAVEAVQASAIRNAECAAIPKTLRRQLQKEMTGSSEAWDVALYNLARTKLQAGVKGGKS